MKKLLPFLVLPFGLMCLLLVSFGASAAVSIVSQPSSVTVAPGGTIELPVVATSTRTLRYYWYKNGTMLSNKTPTLTITNATAASAGTYYCLVSDGDTKARCAEFTVTVQEGSAPAQPSVTATCNCQCPNKTGIATLTWTAPTTRANGSALTANQVAGYNIYAGASADKLTKLQQVGRALTVQIADLKPGTHYFALTTIDTGGLESALSTVVRVVVK